MSSGGGAKRAEVSRREFLKKTGIGAMSLAAAPGFLGGWAAVNPEARESVSPGGGNGGAPKGPYNILFILTDQERYFKDYPSALGLEARRKLMRMGVTFTNHCICSNVCSPSRSVIYTGQHIPHTGVFDNMNFPWQPDLSTEIPTIGDMLREAGYYTTYKGKWHLSQELERKGREKYFSDAMEPYGFSDYNFIGDDHGHELGGYYLDHLFAGAAIHWLRSNAPELKRKGQPWFLAVNLINPHDIMYFNADRPDESVQDTGRLPMPIVRAPETALYKRSYDVPIPASALQPLTEPGRPAAHLEFARTQWLMLGRIQSKKEHWKRYQDYYFNCLQDVDSEIGRLLKELEDQNLLQNTIIVFTADHGDMGGAHGLNGKGNVSYEENIHVPMIVVHPAVSGGQSCAAVTSHVDLVPTLLGFSGMDRSKRERILKDTPGRDLGILLADPSKASPNQVRAGALYAYNMLLGDADFLKKVMAYLGSGGDPKKLREQGFAPDLEKKRSAMRTIFDGRYKFSRYFAPKKHNRPKTMEELLKYNDLELFDLERDLLEMRNLAHNPDARRKELILAMNEKLNAVIDEEIGVDVGQMYPGGPDVDWAVTRFDP